MGNARVLDSAMLHRLSGNPTYSALPSLWIWFLPSVHSMNLAFQILTASLEPLLSGLKFHLSPHGHGYRIVPPRSSSALLPKETQVRQSCSPPHTQLTGYKQSWRPNYLPVILGPSSLVTQNGNSHDHSLHHPIAHPQHRVENKEHPFPPE